MSDRSAAPQPLLLPPPRPRRRFVWAMALIAVLIAGGWWIHKETATPAKVGRHDIAAPVTLATIGKGDIDVIDPALGTVTPLANVIVRTQINGQLQEIAFQEGQIVQKGDFLAQIDPRPYQTVLEQDEGALQRDQALLKEAQLNLARYQKLVAQDSIARQQLDTQQSLVQQYQGNIVADQGQIDAAKLNLVYCHITAPVTGRVGLRQIDLGNYAQTSDANGIVTLTQLDPISVLFVLPENQLPAVMKRFSGGAVLTVTALDRNDNSNLAEGRLIAIDNQIDTTTGTVKLRAWFDNPANGLYPNQFVNIQLLVDTLHDAVIAPAAAILRGAPGTFVYVAKDDKTVSLRPVKLGVTQGDKVQILDGLSEGEKIITDGTDKLSDGASYKLPGETPGTKADGKPGDAAGKKDNKTGARHRQSGN